MFRKEKSKKAAEEVIKSIIKEKGCIVFPIDPFILLKDKNIMITFSDFDKLEGLLLYDSKNKSVVSINKNRCISRQRFTAAHELGHMILHGNINSNSFFCPIYGVKSDVEKEANEFASNLLMPTFELIKQVNKYQDSNGNVGLDDCLMISEYFGVSFDCCVRTICYRLNRLSLKLDNDKLAQKIHNYKPSEKKKKLMIETHDLDLLLNMIEYSKFSIVNVNYIVGIKFLQNLVYHDNRLENVKISSSQLNEIFADLRINGSCSKYCLDDNRNIIESLGNLEMNKYCLSTNDDINIFKIIDLNKKLYMYSPYPECTGQYRICNNVILNGQIQPVDISLLLPGLYELNNLVTDVIKNIDDYSISKYIDVVANIHYRLTVLHPFNDGNGRISRAFMNWLLRLKGLCPIYIDSKNKKQYLDALHLIDKENDNTQLQLIICKSIITTMSELHKSWNNY